MFSKIYSTLKPSVVKIKILLEKIKIFFKNKSLIVFLLGVIGMLIGNYIWDFYKDYSRHQEALKKDLIFRYEFITDELKKKEIKTREFGREGYETRIVFVQNLDYFEHAGWFSTKKPETFSESYSGILFYEFNPQKQDYELVYKFIPLAVDQKYLEKKEDQKDPLLLTQAHLGDIDADGKSELITEWSVCNFNHCVWVYPIIIGYDGGYYVKWTMPKHESTEQNLKTEDCNWSGESEEREIMNIHDDRKYKINCGNYIGYKILDDNPTPYIVSYNIDDGSCWACEHHYLIDIFTTDNEFRAKNTYHNSKGLSEHFLEIEDLNFVESVSFQE